MRNITPSAHLRLNYFFSYLFILLCFTFFSCEESNLIPKPEGQIRLTYPANRYKKIENTLPFTFEKSIYATTVLKDKNGWINLNYPNLKATIYISYYPINKNLNDLIKDTEKLTFDKHAVKALEIKGQPFENVEKNVYGTLFKLTGNTATNLQFYITDNTKHFINGSLYFKVKPNYDSLQPAIKYLEKDIKRIMETISWR